MARLGGEYLSIEPLGLGELAGLMMAHGGGEGFGGRHERSFWRGTEAQWNG
jgi:hypothetical protein